MFLKVKQANNECITIGGMPREKGGKYMSGSTGMVRKVASI